MPTKDELEQTIAQEREWAAYFLLEVAQARRVARCNTEARYQDEAAYYQEAAIRHRKAEEAARARLWVVITTNG